IPRNPLSAAMISPLLHLRSRAADDVRPLSVLRAHELGELLGRHRARLDAEVRHAARHRLVRKGARGAVVQPVDDVARGARARAQAHPRRRLEPRQTRLRERGNFGSSGATPSIATGAMSVAGLKGMKSIRWALIANGPGGATNSIWPSAGAFTTKSTPMLPFAPARLSTTNGVPKVLLKSSASARARKSTDPPGGLVAMMRTVWLGPGARARPAGGSADAPTSVETL